MAHARRNGRFEKVIDTTRWAGSRLAFNAQAAGNSALTFISDGGKETLLRIRGELIAYIDGVQTPGGQVDCALGALVVQAGSFTTVIQTPINESDAPWLFYERFTLAYEEMVQDVVDVPGMTSVRRVIDSKAMRILRPGREVQMVFVQQTVQGAMTVNCTFTSRVLLGTA